VKKAGPVSLLGGLVIGLTFLLISVPSPLLAFSTATGTLASNWSPWPGSSGVEFEARIGNAAWQPAQWSAGDWELGYKDKGVYGDTSGHYAWGNNVAVNFDFTHNAAAGTFTLALNSGPSVTWNSGHVGEGVQDIWLLAKTSSGDYTSQIGALSLNGTSITSSLSAAGTKEYMRIYGDLFSDFTLSGSINFQWKDGTTPAHSHIEAMFAVQNFSASVPEPATLVLLGSGLIGLFGIGRKKLFKK
jgi:hypothetical protein